MNYAAISSDLCAQFQFSKDSVTIRSIFAEVHTAKKTQKPARQEEEEDPLGEGGEDDIGEHQDAFQQEEANSSE